ncbi:Aste57867_4042 [Aphanomyces stellatus]|nr:hypothetical protein As57867_004031 [Aphanomyces stellatus]VFT81177.1 Aste57867_4042 [Aphanomyces stellatus]
MVLARTAEFTYQRLMIPLFFLFLGCIMAGAIFYEMERGTQCFAKRRCVWWEKDIMTKELGAPFPQGKRIQVQVDKLTILTDMLRSTWMSIVTFTTVGYGDMKPRTPFGKLLDIICTIFGSCYTAMPLSLIGGQFYSCYEQFLKDHDQMKRGETVTPPTFDAVIARRTRRQSIIGTTDAPILGQFVTLTRLLNEVILNTCRINAMAPEPARLMNGGLPLPPILNSVIQGAEKTRQSVRRMSSVGSDRASSDSGKKITDVARTATALEQKARAVSALLTNIKAATSLTQTIVLNFSIVVEKLIHDDNVDAEDLEASEGSPPRPPPRASQTVLLGSYQRELQAETTPIVVPTILLSTAEGDGETDRSSVVVPTDIKIDNT